LDYQNEGYLAIFFEYGSVYSYGERVSLVG